jgi:cytochrome c553
MQKMASFRQTMLSRRLNFDRKCSRNPAQERWQNETKNMKKLIVLATLLGLVAVLPSKGADAKANWDSLCAKCHGTDGKGDTKIGAKLGCKDFTDAKVQADLKDDAAFKALKEGLKSDEGKTLMKPFDQLSDDEIKALVAYVHTLKK